MKTEIPNSYCVYRWMHEKLYLSGVIESVFAVIYSYSKDGYSECTLSASEIAALIGTSQVMVYQRLKVLTEMGYIIKRNFMKPMPRCAYRVNPKIIREVIDNE